MPSNHVRAHSIALVDNTQIVTLEVVTAGPQGPSGTGSGGTGLPSGGNPGNVLLKKSYSDQDAEWSPVLDGGTFN